MEWIDLGAFGGTAWIGIALATLSAFAVGMAWYTPKVFGNAWMGHVGLTAEEAQNMEGAGARYGMTAVAAFLTALVLALLMMALDVTSVGGGLLLGAVLGLVFRGGAHVIHNGFAMRSFGLTAIDSGHDIVAMAVAGAILGAFI